MARIYETQDSAHRQAVARSLLDAAGDDEETKLSIRTTTGGNGQQAFEVPDDFPDVTAPEPGSEDTDEATGALHHGVTEVFGDTTRDQNEPEDGDGTPKRRHRKTATTAQPDDTQHQ